MFELVQIHTNIHTPTFGDLNTVSLNERRSSFAKKKTCSQIFMDVDLAPKEDLNKIVKRIKMLTSTDAY